jgi:DNA-binding GntR family transcriptional regulator
LIQDSCSETSVANSCCQTILIRVSVKDETLEAKKITYKTKNDFVYVEIKKNILQKLLHPGERLVVSDLAKEYGVSPMPIREALIRLAQEEFVEIIPHVGAKVTSYNEDQLAEIHQIRIELESMATRLAAPVITGDQLKLLDDLMEEGKLVVNSGDIISYFKWNRLFHLSVAEMNPNKTLVEYIKSDWQKMDFISQRFALNEWRSAESYTEHRLWLEALRTRDPIKAETACRNHCSAVSKTPIENFRSW